MKRYPGEPFEDYRARRKGEDMVMNAHLKGRLPGGEYVDPALHSTMEKTVHSEKVKRWTANILLCVISGLSWYLVGTVLYAVF